MMADAVRTRYRRQCSLVSQVCADVRCVLDDERVAAILILLSLGYSGLNHAAMNRRFPCKVTSLTVRNLQQQENQQTDTHSIIAKIKFG